MHTIGSIDIEKFKAISDDLTTNEVIITDERINHIKERHPNDYEKYSKYLSEMIRKPDYILEDKKPSTAIVLKEFISDNEQFQMILRLNTSQDPIDRKNSVMTFMRIGKSRYNQYLRNKKVLYMANRE